MHRREIWARPHPHISAHSPTPLCWMHNICNEIMFPVGMVVAGGWRCAVNINAASPRLPGSIGAMVGGKWIYGSVRSFILLPKATARSPCRWVGRYELRVPTRGVSSFVTCPVGCWMNGMDSLIWRAFVIGRLHCSASEWWHVCGRLGTGKASTAGR